ncbi:MAG: replication initiation protein [Proteobacteria bacterium]|nr:replication initiation protein [Pseudomonadota bacterium]
MHEVVKEKELLELKKNVGAIHSSSGLTLVQRKIANALLYNAYEYLLEKDEHQIHIGTLSKLIGYNSKDSQKIKQALVALISTVIEWNLIDKDRIDSGSTWNASAIISDASLDGSICKYSYSNKMRKLLYRPEMYGRLNMDVQAKFRSTYGLALYENCIRYQNISHTPLLDIETFRKLMGVKDNEYIYFRDFKRRVLDKAIVEVNEYSPILITVRFKKNGRHIVGLQFQIQKKTGDNEVQKAKLTDNAENILSEKLFKNYGFSKRRVDKLLAEYDEQYILEKMSIIESSFTFQQGKIFNLARYLEKALDEDYQPVRSSKDLIKEMHKDKESDDQKKQKEQYMIQYRRYQDQEILKFYQSCTEKEKIEIDKDFTKSIQKNMYLSLFLKDGLSNVLVADRFCDFIRAYKKNFLERIMSFDEFLNQL